MEVIRELLDASLKYLERSRFLTKIQFIESNQARARQHPARMTLDNPAIHARRRAEIVGVENEMFAHASPMSFSNRAATLLASKYSTAIARAASHCRR